MPHHRGHVGARRYTVHHVRRRPAAEPGAQERGACGDAIVLEAFGEARWWLPENFDRLALPDLPYCVWWVGDLPDHDLLFDEAIQRRRPVVVVNSAEMDLRDIEKLSNIARSSHGFYALLDLTWVRLRGLLDLVARFFDDPATLPYLSRLKSVTLTYNPRPGESDAASTRCGIFIGWLATQLKLQTETARWHRDASGGRGHAPARGGLSPVAIRINQEKLADAHDGAITRITMVCDGPTGDGRSSEIVREGAAISAVARRRARRRHPRSNAAFRLARRSEAHDPPARAPRTRPSLRGVPLRGLPHRPRRRASPLRASARTSLAYG